LAVLKGGLSNEFLEKISKDVRLIDSDYVKSIIDKKCKNWGFSRILSLSGNESEIKQFEKKLAAKGAFPNKKNNSLFFDERHLLEEIEKYKNGEQEIKTDKGGNMHSLIGNVDFSFEQLEDNFKMLNQAINNLKPANWKGEFLKSVTLSTNMGPGLKTMIIK